MKRLFIVIFFLFFLVSCSGNSSKGTGKLSFLSPDLVTPIYPETGTTVTGSSVKLKWGKINPPQGTVFILTVGTDPDHMKVVDKNIIKRSYNISLKKGRYYFWQVTAVDGIRKVTGDISLFRTSSLKSPTGKIKLVSPSLNENVETLPISLSWSGVSGMKYTVLIGNSVNDMNPFATDITKTAYLFSPTHIGYYFWKVVGKDNGGNEISSLLGFFYVTDNLAAPKIIGPTYGDFVTQDRIDFWWSQVTGATSYNLYVGSYPDNFTMEIKYISGNNYSVTLPSLEAGYVFWKVEAVSALGGKSESSLGWFIKYKTQDIRRFKFVASSMEGKKGGDICVIDDANRVWCWGANTYRQLGVDVLIDIANRYDRTFYEELANTSPRLMPFPAGYNYKSVAVGISGVCAITTDGELWCARYKNPYGVDFGLVLQRLGVDHSWSRIKNKYNYYCAVDEEDQLWCWGDFLKNNSPDFSAFANNPVKIVFPGGFRLIMFDTGKKFACAYGELEYDNKPATLCWGDASNGQLGFSPSPVTIPALYGVKIIKLKTGSDDVCVITSNYKLLCWGGNYGGKISSSLSEKVEEPYKILNPQNLRWINVDPGPYNTCAIDEDKNLWCWGKSVIDGRDFSGFGSMMTTAVYLASPHLVKKGVLFENIVSTPLARCGLQSDGTLFCWGDRLYGVLGDSYRLDAICSSPSYKEVYNGDGVGWKLVKSGKFSMCAIDEDNQLWCWGSNEFGSLGLGINDTSAARGVPVKVTVEGVKGWKYVTMEKPFFNNEGNISNLLNGTKDIPVFRCALAINGDIYCWGNNDYGEIGNGLSGGNVYYPAKVSGGHKWIAVSTGFRHTCAIDIYHKLWCWGDNNHFQLGVSNISSSSVPVKVSYSGPLTWSEVKSVYDATCALSTDGEVFCWGWSGSGVTGSGSDISVPTLLPDLAGKKVEKIVDAFSDMCALEDNGDIHCWGRDIRGLPGGGKPGGVDYWTNLYGGLLNFCASDQDQNVWCWGSSMTGLVQFFTGSVMTSFSIDEAVLSPPLLITYFNRVRSLAPGLVASCYVNKHGALFCGGRKIEILLNGAYPTLNYPPHMISDLRAALGTRFSWEPVRFRFGQDKEEGFLYNNYLSTLLQGY